MANDAHNEAMGVKGEPSPLEQFSRSDVRPNTRYWQPFGCPVYVLDNELQSAHKINKWIERSRVGLYLGRSPHHARSVALVLNLQTGHVSPQFHVSFDPCFQTVKPTYGGQPSDSQWLVKCGFQEPPAAQQEKAPSAAVEWAPEQVEAPVADSSGAPSQRSGSQPSAVKPQGQKQVRFNLNTRQGEPPAAAPTPRVIHRCSQEERETYQEAEEQPEVQPQTSSRGCTIRAPKRLIQAMVTSVLCATSGATPSEGATLQDHSMVPGELLCESALFLRHDFQPEVHPIQAYKASADPDTLYHHEAMHAPDQDQFKVAMEKEFNDQLNNGNFSLKHRSQVPEGATILPSVWAMRRKWKVLTGEVYKWKACLNMDGSRQVEGWDFWQTYAPVATWGSI